jgi:hypothetical protein
MVEPTPTLQKLRELEHRVAEIEREKGLKTPGGDGTSGGMEPRIAKLEASVEHVQQDIRDIKSDIHDICGDITGIRTTDFRIIFGAIIAVALGLAGLIAHGFRWI